MNAIIYSRVSTASQVEGTSLESQTAACERYAHENRLNVKRVAHEVYSAASLYDRPVLSEIRNELKDGYYDHVICYAVDRLSRNVGHLWIIVDEFERYGVTLHFVTETLDTSSEGKLLQSIKGYVAEVEREKIKERTMRGRRQAALNGTLGFGRKLYGYDVTEEGKRVVNEREAEVVKRIFDMVLDGRSLRSIATSLNNGSTPTPQGSSTWYAQNIKQIVNNPAYCGRTVAFRTRHDVRYVSGRKVHKGSVLNDPKLHIVMPDVTPPIISIDDWEAAQIQLQRNRQEKRRQPTLQSLLRGIVRCANCGRLFSPRLIRNYCYYVCTSTQSPTAKCGTKGFPAMQAEQAVWSETVKILTDPDHARHYVDEPAPDPTPAIERQMDKLKTELARIIQRSGTADDAAWQMFEIEIAKKQKDIARLEEEKHYVAMERQSRRSLQSPEEILAGLDTDIEHLSFEQKSQTIRALGIHCTWDGITLTINRLVVS